MVYKNFAIAAVSRVTCTNPLGVAHSLGLSWNFSRQISLRTPVCPARVLSGQQRRCFRALPATAKPSWGDFICHIRIYLSHDCSYWSYCTQTPEKWNRENDQRSVSQYYMSSGLEMPFGIFQPFVSTAFGALYVRTTTARVSRTVPDGVAGTVRTALQTQQKCPF